MPVEGVSYCNAELIETSMLVSAAYGVSCTESIGGRHRVIPSRPVDELLNNSPSVLGKTFVIQSENVNGRSGRCRTIADCCNRAIQTEAEETLASGQEGRYELGAIILPPTVLFLCSVAIQPLHAASREACDQVPVVEV